MITVPPVNAAPPAIIILKEVIAAASAYANVPILETDVLPPERLPTEIVPAL